MNRDFIKGIIVGVIGLWTIAANNVCRDKIKENKELKEIIRNKEEEA